MPKNGMPRSRAIARGAHHAPRAAQAEPARHQDAVGAVQQVLAAVLLERLGLDPVELHPRAVREAAVVQRLVQALVRVRRARRTCRRRES